MVVDDAMSNRTTQQRRQAGRRYCVLALHGPSDAHLHRQGQVVLAPPPATISSGDCAWWKALWSDGPAEPRQNHEGATP